MTQKLLGAVIGAATALVLVSACTSTADSRAITSDTDVSQQEPRAETPVAPGGQVPDDQRSERDAPDESADAGDDDTESENDGCWVQLFDSDDFDENDDHFTLTQPGNYEDFADLPGADQDWTDEADSMRVGDSATVTVFTEKGLTGDQLELASGSEHADIDDVYSLTMTC